MEKRYQVFVSSTYEDLHDARQEVMHALLELDCIPAGMELFPAANEDQWSLIKKVIEDCDYYIVISAGRYGSIATSGMSYTEMEYRYALELKKPTIAFLHKDLSSLSAKCTEPSTEGKQKLDDFRKLLQQKMCKYWINPSDLGSVVSRSLVQLIKNHPAIGWIKADQATDALTAPEMLRLRKRIEELEKELHTINISAPNGSDSLSQGTDTFNINCSFQSETDEGQKYSWAYSTKISWNDIFSTIAPYLIDEASDRTIRSYLNKLIESSILPKLNKDKEAKGHKSFSDFSIKDDDYQTIKIQFRALGLFQQSVKHRRVADHGTYWTLTQYGDLVMTQLRAIKKPSKNN